MEIKEYIESGILDLYALGNLSSEECAGVECMIASHPELKIELELIQNSLAKYSSTFEKEVPDALRAKVLDSLEFSAPNNNDIAAAHKVIDISATNNTNNNSSNDSVNTPIIQSPSYYKLGIAAGFFILFTSIGYNIWLSSNLNNKQKLIETANNELLMNKKINSQLKENNLILANNSKILSTPGNVIISLAGSNIDPKAKATVIWNKNTKATSIALDNMPNQIAEKQYQLWAIVAGKPVDLGVLPQNFNSDSIINAKLIDQPQAFAITIEPKGGSINPTLSQLIVIGNL